MNNSKGLQPSGDKLDLKGLARLIGLPAKDATLRLLKTLFQHLVTASTDLTDRYLENREKFNKLALRDSARKIELQLREKEKTLLLELLRGGGGLQLQDFSDYDDFLRRFNEATVYRLALELTGEDPPGEEAGEGGTKQDKAPLSPHWLDLFQQFARTKNEPWRQMMLARCLAQENANPGVVSIRTVWNIAMLETREFQDIQDFINYSARLYENGNCSGFCMVGYYAQLTNSDYRRGDGQVDSIDDLFKRLEGYGFLALGNGALDLWAEAQYRLEMGDRRFAISLSPAAKQDMEKEFLAQKNADAFREVEGGNQRFSLFAMPLTSVGNQLARLFNWDPSASAVERFEKALKSQVDQLSIDSLHDP